MLERHLEEWARYPLHVKQHFRAVIVDDGSPGDPAIEHLTPDSLPLTSIELYRIKQNIPWNVGGARNLGMDRAPDGWCLLTDIDHLLEKAAAIELLNCLALFEAAEFGTFARRWADGRKLHSHPNSFLLQRSLYWKVGGCDEDWSGWWGAGEQVFRKTLHHHGREIALPTVYLTHFGRDDIADASTREWGRRGSEWDWRNNPKLVAKAKRAPYRPENPLRFEWEKVTLNSLLNEAVNG